MRMKGRSTERELIKMELLAHVSVGELARLSELDKESSSHNQRHTWEEEFGKG